MASYLTIDLLRICGLLLNFKSGALNANGRVQLGFLSSFGGTIWIELSLGNQKLYSFLCCIGFGVLLCREPS